jgi:hypothetical protein
LRHFIRRDKVTLLNVAVIVIDRDGDSGPLKRERCKTTLRDVKQNTQGARNDYRVIQD